MKSKNISKKLMLNKETVVDLKEKEQDLVRGGGRTNGNGTTCNSCLTTCNGSIEFPCPC
jgi:hypothetical protein